MINPAIEQRSRQHLDIIAGDLARADDLGPDLAAGAAGVALFFAYRYQASGDDADGDAALKFLERALTSATAEAEAGLFRKRLGVAWVLAHLADSLVDLGDHDPNDAMDAAVLRVLDGPVPFYDLMSGLAGIGIYALERLPRPAAVAILERVVDELGRRAQRDGDGITWFTPPELLPPVYRARAPHGCFRLGLAQGIPGVVGLLGHMRSAGVCIEAVDELLEHAVAWLRSRARPARRTGTTSGSRRTGRPSLRLGHGPAVIPAWPLSSTQQVTPTSRWRWPGLSPVACRPNQG